MKNIVFLLLVVLLAGGCTSSQKMLNYGNYDGAINKSVTKLRRNKTKEKEVKVLEEAFSKAVKRDDDQIAALKKEGRPDCWDEIFQIYSRMRSRQERVSPLLPLKYKSTGKIAQFDIRNYNDELTSSKQKAAEFYYVNGKSLLDKGGKYDARAAYEEFGRIAQFYQDYKDTRTLMEKAHQAGMSYVLMGVKNNAGQIIPQRLDEELKTLPLNDLNSFWVNFHNSAQSNYQYDYTVVINIKNIVVTPEKMDQNNYKESTEIKDGMQYVLDSKGNVKKDSLGNDIKVPKWIKVEAQVKEVHQFKKATLQGTLDVYNNLDGQLLKSDPITGENIFENFTATFIGDERALTEATKKKLGPAPRPFPANAEMVYQAGLVLKNMCKGIVANNKGLFR